MVESCGKRCNDGLSLDVLQRKFADRLKGKRFLLVLDDLWGINRSQWCKLRGPLVSGEPGSMVLATTRNLDVVAIIRSTKCIHLDKLSDADSWSIFQKGAFVDGVAETYPKLEAIGKEIVKKAKGVPLAVNTLGCLLHNRLEEWRWRSILESEIWRLPRGDQDILLSLRLSYRHLSSHLKQCFAFCSLFPRNHRFERQLLIQMWIAQGFVQTQGTDRAEDIGCDYFDDLLQKSFFRPSGAWYVMHELLHDLALVVSVDECLRIGKNHLHTIDNLDHQIRHLSLSRHADFKLICGFKKTRTLLGISSQLHQNYLNEIMCSLKYLQVLDLSSCDIFHLPDSIHRLKQLKYLDLSNTTIRWLPESLATLYSLQTFRLKDCVLLKKLPRHISNLINLRHLVADAKLLSKIDGIGKLTALQELEVFSVSKDRKCKIEELKNMTELRGKLCIQNLENIKDREEACQDVLDNKLHLDELELNWHDHCGRHRRDYRFNLEILETLRPPRNIRILRIRGYGGATFPSWMDTKLSENLERLFNLEHIYLHKCKQWKILPCLGKLPFLRHLSIRGMDSVNSVGYEFSGPAALGFPLLESLEFYDMPEWVEWLMAEEDQSFCCLQNLVIKNCPSLTSHGLPFSERIKSLEVANCPGVLNESLFVLLQNQNSLSFFMKIDYQNLLSCIKEALHYLTALEALSIRYHDDHETSSPSQEELVSLVYNIDPRKYNAYSSSADLDIFRFSVLENDNINVCDDSLSFCLQNDLTSLCSFSVYGSPDISSLRLEAVLPYLNSLEELEISCCKKLMDLKWLSQKTTSLKALKIWDCPDLASIPKEVLSRQTALEQLSIDGCDDLTSLGFQNLTSLKSLWIDRCPKLMASMSSSTLQFEYEQWLPNLLFLSVDSSTLLTTKFMNNLASLQKLTIHRCSQLIFFSDEEEKGLLSITNMQYLEIAECQYLQYLPANMWNLSSLRSLVIVDCPLLKSLSLQGLPPFLSSLEISECPELIKRCQKDEGNDWHMIAHIPELKIQSEEVKSKDLLL